MVRETEHCGFGFHLKVRLSLDRASPPRPQVEGLGVVNVGSSVWDKPTQRWTMPPKYHLQPPCHRHSSLGHRPFRLTAESSKHDQYICCTTQSVAVEISWTHPVSSSSQIPFSLRSFKHLPKQSTVTTPSTTASGYRSPGAAQLPLSNVAVGL